MNVMRSSTCEDHCIVEKKTNLFSLCLAQGYFSFFAGLLLLLIQLLLYLLLLPLLLLLLLLRLIIIAILNTPLNQSQLLQSQHWWHTNETTTYNDPWSAGCLNILSRNWHTRRSSDMSPAMQSLVYHRSCGFLQNGSHLGALALYVPSLDRNWKRDKLNREMKPFHKPHRRGIKCIRLLQLVLQGSQKCPVVTARVYFLYDFYTWHRTKKKKLH